MKFLTENKIPNQKVLGGFAVTLAAGFLVYAGKKWFHVDIPAEEIKDKLELIITGIGAIVFIAQYYIRPRKGDGIVPKK